ncbi:MAG TPA: carboxypeptidase regulatory-like domain-containing protein [Candidatus Polarisedimenticolia bacterium]|nr:carboxypeptidase regulatory-like domain-containing protein [Candidatus Polarisedimenticolia bacterium]
MRNRNAEKHAGALVTMAVVLFVMLPLRSYAQVSGATLTGTVSDSSGAVIPNVHLSIKNEGTGEVRSVIVDSAGFYSAPNLLPGQYDVTVTAPGFATTVQKGVTLTVGAQQLLNVKMLVGQVTQTVEVQDLPPSIDLATSTIGGVVGQEEVAQLPLNGRDWTSLATLQPGVDSVGSVQANTGGPDRARRGYGVQMTISGTRPTQNNYRIDGISVNDYTNGGPGSVEGSTLGVDAVQEFSVLTSNYSAEYGRTAGGVVNALTKPGTNAFHGDVYEFMRNSALDAKNYFDQPGSSPLFHRNQFGGAIGGPIVKDKTFFFADYEGLRESNGITTQVTVPSLAARQGILCSKPQDGTCNPHQVTGAANPDPATGIDKAVLPYLGLWGPENPNLPYFNNGDAGTYSFVGGHVTSENFGVGRLDHRFSDKDSFFGSYQYDLATLTQPDPNNDVLVGNTTGRGYVALEETHIINSQIINAARFGLNRSLHTAIGMKAINPLAGNLALGENPGADNPQIDILSGYNSIQPGLNQIERLDFFENSYQGYDDLFWTHGIHGLKIGFAVERVQLNAFDPAPAGEVQFGSLADPNSNGFLTNNPIDLSAPLPSAPFIHFNFRSTIFGGYIQDDIRLRPTLTLNVGLRYEMSTVPSEVHGHLSALNSPFNQSFQDTIVGSSVFSNPTHRNFEPRVGFAWDPFGDGKTSVRGGFGIFDVLPLPYLLGQFATNTAPFTENGSAVNLPPGSFPTQAFNILSSAAQNNQGLRIAYIQPNPKRDYLMQWNVSVQRELVPNLTAMAAYVGSRGVHQIFRADDINSTQPINGSNPPYLWPVAPQPPLPPNPPISPNIGRMDVLAWNNDSYFDGLETQIQKHMNHGLEIGGSYTWSRAIDGGDGSIASDAFLNSIPALFFFLPKYRRTASDFNITHNLTINYLWSVPSGHLAGPVAWIAKGWQLGGIAQIRSGLPFTALLGGDPLGLNDSAPFAYPNRLTGPGCGAPVNPQNALNYIKGNCFALPTMPVAQQALCDPGSFAGAPTPAPAGTVYCQNLLGNGSKNDLYGPGLIDFDFSAVKDTQIGERVKVEFRAEMFNVFNRPNFNPPLVHNFVFDGSGSPQASPLDTTATTSRQVQFALKVIF